MTDQQFRGGRLREFREGRGLTQQDVADEVSKLAWFRNGVRVGVNADVVSKWERGLKRPSTLYRDLLCLRYETPDAHLGIAGPLILATTSPEDALDAALAETLVGMTAICAAVLGERRSGECRETAGVRADRRGARS